MKKIRTYPKKTRSSLLGSLRRVGSYIVAHRNLERLLILVVGVILGGYLVTSAITRPMIAEIAYSNGMVVLPGSVNLSDFKPATPVTDVNSGDLRVIGNQRRSPVPAPSTDPNTIVVPVVYDDQGTPRRSPLPTEEPKNIINPDPNREPAPTRTPQPIEVSGGNVINPDTNREPAPTRTPQPIEVSGGNIINPNPTREPAPVVDPNTGGSNSIMVVPGSQIGGGDPGNTVMPDPNRDTCPVFPGCSVYNNNRAHFPAYSCWSEQISACTLSESVTPPRPRIWDRVTTLFRNWFRR